MSGRDRLVSRLSTGHLVGLPEDLIEGELPPSELIRRFQAPLGVVPLYFRGRFEQCKYLAAANVEIDVAECVDPGRIGLEQFEMKMIGCIRIERALHEGGIVRRVASVSGNRRP